MQTTRCNYFPIQHGRYEVKPGLFPLGHNFGNGVCDQQLFQFDHAFERYRQTKIEARQERLAKYLQLDLLSPALASQISQLIVQQLSHEHPDLFRLQEASGLTTLSCHLTQEILCFDRHFNLQADRSKTDIHPAYLNNLDALAMQLQEDIAVICQHGNHNRIEALHLCFPNHWAAEEKIGHDFIRIHEPVPGMEKINARASEIVSAMINKGPFVRFAWGVTADACLNHHPQSGVEQHFNPTTPSLYLRVERQVIYGLPTHQAALFLIRTYLYNVNEVCQDKHKCRQLATALQTMPSESQRYKGIEADVAQILDWLKATV